MLFLFVVFFCSFAQLLVPLLGESSCERFAQKLIKAYLLLLSILSCISANVPLVVLQSYVTVSEFYFAYGI